MDISKKICWLGNSLKNLKNFPEATKDDIGYALHKVQQGAVPTKAKPLKGLKPAVMEIVSNYNTDTYRAMYTVKIDDTVYILHCFQKKSKKGIKTDKQTMDLIRQRLREAETLNAAKR